MNPILLDTHAAIWIAENRLKPNVAKDVNLAAERNEVLLSPITAWEIGTLVARGRLTMGIPVQDFVRELFAGPGILVAALTPEIALAATALPGKIHNDPADRIIIATAAAYDAYLLTRDRAILEYARTTRHVRCLAC